MYTRVLECLLYHQGPPRGNTKCLAPAEGCLITCIVYFGNLFHVHSVSSLSVEQEKWHWMLLAEVTIVAIVFSPHAQITEPLFLREVNEVLEDLLP